MGSFVLSEKHQACQLAEDEKCNERRACVFKETGEPSGIKIEKLMVQIDLVEKHQDVDLTNDERQDRAIQRQQVLKTNNLTTAMRPELPFRW